MFATVAASAGWLVTGAGLALAAAVVVPTQHHAGAALAAAAVAAFGAWLLVALVGHAHKVVPFIVWSVLRGRGVAKLASGRPLAFGDLYDHRVAALSYGLLTGGLVALCVGLAGSEQPATALGGALLVAGGFAVAANSAVISARLAWRPDRQDQRARSA
jgi:hypothetical protein